MVETIKALDTEEIKRYLPHREPFLFIDRAEDIEPSVRGTGYKKIQKTEPFFKGHFPEKPILPGVLGIEALAQTACLVVAMSYPEKTDVLFRSLEKVKFKKAIYPDCEMKMVAEKVSSLQNVYKFSGKLYVNEELMTEAVFTALILPRS